jgi:hypothetical protein
MLRFLYRRVLHAHPPYFRKRFVDEMLAIFDEAESRAAALGLLGDAVVSLGRQWMLRPQFWEEPAPSAIEGGVLFAQISDFRPRAIALAYGAVMSAIVLNGVSLTMGYIWEHPHYEVEIRQPVITPPASWQGRSQPNPGPDAAVEPPLYTDQGRVLLVFNAPPHVAQPTPDGKRASSAVSASDPNASAALQPYVGRYIASLPDAARINVEIFEGRLQLEAVGRFHSPLVLAPQPNVWVCEIGDCRVAFSTNAKGEVDHVDIRYAGLDLRAFRERSGMIF